MDVFQTIHSKIFPSVDSKIQFTKSKIGFSNYIKVLFKL